MQPALTSHPAISVEWTASQRFLFRLACLFFILYILLNPNGFFPYYYILYGWYCRPFYWMIAWAGHHILQIHGDIREVIGGSGDTTYDYATLFFIVLSSLVGAIAWTLFDRTKGSYPKLYYWVTVAVRYYLGFTLYTYGLNKVIKMQFPDPNLFRLTERYGVSSPMGLAWTFLGYSKGYNIFLGLAEVSAGLLVMFRRTLLGGALLAFVLSANIMAINYCFDVCVKLTSTAMVAMSLFLLIPKMQLLWDLFFRDRLPAGPEGGIPQRPAPLQNPTTQPHQALAQKRWRRTGRVAKYIAIGFVVGFNILDNVVSIARFGDLAPRIALRGVYEVQTFVKGNTILPPLLTDTVRWQQLLIDGNWIRSSAGIRTMNDSITRYTYRLDTIHHTFKMYIGGDTAHALKFSYLPPAGDSLLIMGRWKGDTVSMVLRRKDPSGFLLKSRGFRWVSETPFNR